MDKSGFAGRLKMLAKAAGGQATLAELSGVPKDTIAKYSVGRSEPSLERLVALARAGGVTVDWLATGVELNGPSAERELDDIERTVESAATMPLDTTDGRHAAALQTLRRIALDNAQERETRLRAARLGTIAFQDQELERTLERIENEKNRALGGRFREISSDIESAIEEVGYRPPPAVLEALKSAMYSHGLKRDGAVALLSSLQATDRDRT